MFVVFEGIDVSGKTTISNRVVRRSKQRGIATCHLRQDGKFASSVWAAAPVATLKSLARLDDERSWQWRERWLERAPRSALESLGSLHYSPRSRALLGWQLARHRQRLDVLRNAAPPALNLPSDSAVLEDQQPWQASTWNKSS